MSLVQMMVGAEGTVRQLAGGLAFTRRIEAMGIRPGVRLVKTSGSYLGGPVTVRAGNVQLALGYGMASKVMVEVETEAGAGCGA
jgi:ferrous iron transport protein A